MKNVYVVRTGDSAAVYHGRELVEKGFALMRDVRSNTTIHPNERLNNEFKHVVCMQAVQLVTKPLERSGQIIRAPRAVWLEVLEGGAA